jgi:hypothetical protein
VIAISFTGNKGLSVLYCTKQFSTVNKVLSFVRSNIQQELVINTRSAD